jgi:hypothetical protein
MVGFSSHFDKPLGLHSSEIRAAVSAQALLGVKHTSAVHAAYKYHPVPERPLPFHVPFDREQREIGERIQSAKRYLSNHGVKAVLIKQPAIMVFFLQ